MAHTEPDEFREVLGDELRFIIGNDPWRGLRELLTGTLHNDFDILLDHGRTLFPMHDATAEPLQPTAQR